MAMPTFTPQQDYAAFTILRQIQLNDLAASVQDYFNDIVRNNMLQLALDVFGNTYSYNNNGIQTQTPFLAAAVAMLADNETITGNWTFSGNTTFSGPVTSSSTFSSTGQARCKAYLTTANQVIANATESAVLMAAEVYDVGAMHDNALNTSRITIPTGGSGVYDFSAQARFLANATGRREMHLYKNGSKFCSVVETTASAGFDSFLQINAQDQGTAGDYYELYVYQSSGGNLDLVFGVTNTFFSCLKAW